MKNTVGCAKPHFMPRSLCAAVCAAVFAAVSLLCTGCIGSVDPDDVVPIADPSGMVGDSRNSIVVNPDNTDNYLVSVYAASGTRLMFVTAQDAHQEVTVGTDGVVNFNVPSSCLMSSEPVDGSVYSATPLVYMLNDDGTQTQVRIGSVQLDVPALDIVYATPADVSAEDGVVTISGSVAQIDAVITVGGETALVGADGSFSISIPFLQSGSFDVIAEARMGGYQINRMVFHVTVTTVAAGDAPIQLPYEYGDSTYNQRVKNSVDTVSVWGKVPIGYSLSVSCASEYVSFAAEPTVDETGLFRFDAVLSQAGDYVLTLTASSPGGASYTRDIHVQRAPDWASYIEGAWATDYNAFTRPSDRAYEVKGTVTSVVEDGDSLIVTIELADGNTIELQYYNHYSTAGALTVGKSYNRIYGHPLGLNGSGVPRFFVWFVEG